MLKQVRWSLQSDLEIAKGPLANLRCPHLRCCWQVLSQAAAEGWPEEEAPGGSGSEASDADRAQRREGGGAEDEEDEDEWGEHGTGALAGAASSGGALAAQQRLRVLRWRLAQPEGRTERRGPPWSPVLALTRARAQPSAARGPSGPPGRSARPRRQPGPA